MPGICIPQGGDDSTRSDLEGNLSPVKSKLRSAQVAESALWMITFHWPLFYLESKSAGCCSWCPGPHTGSSHRVLTPLTV